MSLPVRKIWAFALALDGGGARNEWSSLRAHLAEAEWIKPTEPKDLLGVGALPEPPAERVRPAVSFAVPEDEEATGVIKPAELARPAVTFAVPENEESTGVINPADLARPVISFGVPKDEESTGLINPADLERPVISFGIPKDEESTGLINPADLARPVMSFGVPRDEEATGLINPADLARRVPVLPFMQPERIAAEEEEIEELSDDEVEDATQTDDSALFGDDPNHPMVLPFVAASPAAPAVIPVRPLPAPFAPVSAPLVEQSPPAPATAPLVEQLPISLDVYAAVKVAFWDKAEERADIEDTLGEHGIDEDTWRAGEERLNEALAEEAREGRSDLARALRAAIKRAHPGRNQENTLSR